MLTMADEGKRGVLGPPFLAEIIWEQALSHGGLGRSGPTNLLLVAFDIENYNRLGVYCTANFLQFHVMFLHIPRYFVSYSGWNIKRKLYKYSDKFFLRNSLIA